MSCLGIATACRPVHTKEEVAQAIVELVEEDVVCRWGRARIHHKLKLHKGMHDANSGFVRQYLAALDADNVLARTPGQQHLQKSSLWTIGPSEEWSGDGHDKLARMGLPIWGLRDKASWRLLGLWVVPNSHILQVPAVLFLQTVLAVGGVPLKVTLDQGSEGSLLGQLQTELRAQFAPDLDPVALPPFSQIKSVYNITIKRSWRLLYENELAPSWRVGKLEYARVSTTKLSPWKKWSHSGSGPTWSNSVWTSMFTNATRRKFAGNTPNEFWFHPTNWDMQNWTVPVPAQHVERLLQDYASPHLWRFVSAEDEELWEVYARMLEMTAIP
ncbi:hypothetical protein DACRYDRAFT_99739 [Dacryopinax primogenitus]|uniref:Integrase catalytic domain-containing protein n=1 Tax=Dacryopinax primogenitus (strain DJM 731) TaxID=1858805 RepID=M5FXH1_DACPD|nr:uncharacterized protein DACRYDRAFT_99739 [Dacryopinax primogenitus]EJU02686.1 hypothetical protein DACRYDRAFT_99739 [Dacryopinax primogenitus]